MFEVKSEVKENVEINKEDYTNKRKVYIIILNYNNWADTIECLESVLRNDYPNYQVIVVDNNSPNNSMDYIKAWAEGKIDVWVDPKNPLRRLSFPPVPKPIPYVYYTKEEAEKGGNKDLEKDLSERITTGITTKYPLIFIQTGENLGFTGGNNVGIRYALAKDDFSYIWILNNDTVIEKDTLEEMVKVIEKSSSIGGVGSLLLFYHDPEIIQCLCGTTPFSPKKAMRLKHLFGNYKLWELYDKLSDNFELNGGLLQGASMLFRKETIERCGLFDESLFMMFDESELCIRITISGWLLYCASKSKVYHKEGGSRGNIKRRKKLLWFTRNRYSFETYIFTVYLYFRNMIYSIHKHYGLSGVITFFMFNLPVFFRVVLGIILFDDQKVKRLKLFFKAIRDGLRGNLGRPW